MNLDDWLESAMAALSVGAVVIAANILPIVAHLLW